MKLAKRLEVIKPSLTLEITAKVGAMKAEGINIIGFGAGEPDFDTPEHIKQAAVTALEKGFTKYTPVSGIVPLKDAIRAKLERENGLIYARDEIIVSCGGKHSLYNIAMALFQEGDEILVPSPYWVSYPEIVSLTGAEPKIIKTGEENNFLLTADQFQSAITSRTRALILNYPSNPTGSTYTKKELEEIAVVAVDKNILVISDEIYDRIIYTEEPHYSIATLGDRIKELTITVNGLSKTYSMTGWRIGYTAAKKELIKGMNIIQGQSTSNPTSIAQYAAVEALNGPQESIDIMMVEFRKRRDYITGRLRNMKGVTCLKPSGSFYVFPNISSYFGKGKGALRITNSLEMTDYLLTEAQIAVIPGIAFGDDAGLRLSFAISFEDIEEGMDRMEKALKNLS